MNRYRVFQLKIIFLVLHSLFAQAKLGKCCRNNHPHDHQASDSLGGVFPIPLLTFQSDPSFTHCPGDHGIYAHTTNCSLFHLCSFGVHRVYACLEGFYYNPISKRCQFSVSVRWLNKRLNEQRKNTIEGLLGSVAFMPSDCSSDDGNKFLSDWWDN